MHNPLNQEYSLASAQTEANCVPYGPFAQLHVRGAAWNGAPQDQPDSYVSRVLGYCSSLFSSLCDDPPIPQGSKKSFPVLILFQDKNHLLKLKCYKTYAAVCLVILGIPHLVSSLCIPNLFFLQPLNGLLCLTVPSLPLHLTLCLSYGIS